MKKVVIVGAGPAGLFAAHELAKSFDVTIVEKKQYVGGSGLHSDGKLILHPSVGGNLVEFLPEDKIWTVLDSIDKVFQKYGIEQEVDYRKDELDELETRAAKAGIKFIPTKQKHIGSDRLPKVMQGFRNDLEKMGVKFKLNTKVLDMCLKKDLVAGVKTDKGSIGCDFVLLAPGRSGSTWVKELCDKFDLDVQFNPVDIGVRVEVSAKVMEEVTAVNRDPKFHIRTKTYDDFIRTFCTCPYGFVTIENYGDSIFGVNGHSMYNKGSDNTNFAFIVRVGLTEPFEDTTECGRSIAYQTNTLGGRKPLIQRLGDLRAGRRSTWDRINRSNVVPTLKKVTPGDIAMAYSYRIIKDILEGLEMLNEVIPGVDTSSTLLYAPEIKFYARRIKTTGYLQTKIQNLFVAGDGAGVSRGIIGAAATGIIAARGILA